MTDTSSPALAPAMPHDSFAPAPLAGQETLTSDVKRAIIWRSGSQIAAQIVSWSSTLIVMRLLSPSDYGLFAMSLVMLSFLTFLNGYGFASALIQERDLDQHRIRQAFGLLLSANALIASVQWFVAPSVAAYYGQPVVADMLRVQTLIYVSTPFIAIPEVLMGRRLDFRSQAIVNLSSALTGAILSLVMAWADFGVWTLVYAPIVMFWVRAIGLTILARSLVWPSFDFRGCGSIFRFGLAILLTQLFWLVQTQSDIFVIGRKLTPHEVGVYSQAVFLATIFYSRFVPPLNEVAFPAYSRLQDDLPGLRWAFLRSARLIMLIAAPLYVGMAASAKPLVATLFGPIWHELPPLIEFMALAMPFMTLQVLFSPALNAIGKPGVPVRTAIAGAAIFAASFVAAAQFGIMAVAMVWCLAAPLLLLATVLLSRSALGIGLGDMWRALALPAGSSIAMGTIVWAADRWLIANRLDALPVLHLGLLVVVGVIAYAGVIHAADRAALGQIWGLIRRKPEATV
ncbi:lipopolysaccharide biosynthesis protein [Novosphingobium sp. ERN07]|uniref:lipopolysaccharide biosynthesis protein n=1 Tax=Novosphingobium sp. ERN07 TaxID=2726187 RepID=UPI0014568339|nr:lipopolysaccharide biosynthesis protein [Novosphingobium sp. ERN07]NLR72399.1 lipopolysaccharide biosynthesis protein [Novosphingobium sp. ERN07]